MLGKLLKYEIKATARLFLPLYLAVLLFAFINKFLKPFKTIESSNNFNVQSTLGIISIIVYFALIVAIVAMTLIIMIQRFYKNLLGDEGYLMFTLPVSSWKHVLSKMLVSMLWLILSFAIVLCSVFILINGIDILAELPRIISVVRGYIGNTGLFLIPVYALVACAYYIIIIYDAIALGHLFPRHKLLASFGAYIGLYIIGQMTFSVFVLLSANKIFAPMLYGSIPTPPQIIIMGISIICFFTILGAANFILTNIILKKKLNLE